MSVFYIKIGFLKKILI